MLKIKSIVKTVKTLNELSGLVESSKKFAKNNIKKNLISSYSHVIKSVEEFKINNQIGSIKSNTTRLKSSSAYLYRLLHFIYKCDKEAFIKNFKVNNVGSINSKIHHGKYRGIGDFSYNIMIDDLTIMNVTVKPMIINNIIGKTTFDINSRGSDNWADGSYPEIVVTFIGLKHKIYFDTLYRYINLDILNNRLNEQKYKDGEVLTSMEAIRVKYLKSDRRNGVICTYYDQIFRKDISSIFIDNLDKSELIGYIDGWNNNIDMMKLYDKKSIAYSTSILLYGEPGCGKSSLIRSIISHMYYNELFEPNVKVVPVDSIIKEPDEVFDEDISSTIEGVYNRYDTSANEILSYAGTEMPPEIWVFEDIDSLFVNRRDVKDKELAAAQNAFLQFLDGIEGRQKRLIIMTTNHLDILEGESEEEKQDSALTRPGRINYRLEVKPATKAIAEEMCLSFNTTLEEISPGFGEDETIRQSKLEQMILLKMAKENGGKEID